MESIGFIGILIYYDFKIIDLQVIKKNRGNPNFFLPKFMFFKNYYYRILILS
jgi:hypothetical protein